MLKNYPTESWLKKVMHKVTSIVKVVLKNYHLKIIVMLKNIIR